MPKAEYYSLSYVVFIKIPGVFFLQDVTKELPTEVSSPDRVLFSLKVSINFRNSLVKLSSLFISHFPKVCREIALGDITFRASRWVQCLINGPFKGH